MGVTSTFQNPGNEFRGAPFWAWNGVLDPETCRRQIRLMREGGLGGFFMHSRVGLGTAYLSDEWFRCVNACLDEARGLHMRAWLYDEDRWPSGAAGGLVTRDPRFRRRRLAATLLRAAPAKGLWTKRTIAVFTARLALPKKPGAPVVASSVRRVAKGARPRPAKGESILALAVELEEPSSWYNNGTYLDTMNPAAVKAFIGTTHEAYAKHCKDAFGSVSPGIFTDEPNHGNTFERHSATRFSIAWTDGLPAAFRKRHGYDLVPRLPELFLEVEGVDSAAVRLHYNDTASHLFSESFGRLVGEWCDRNGMESTGHLLEEDTLVRQSTCVGSCMRFYEYMQAPGMDMLTENWRVFATAKQVSSAARQFGRRRRITETYGCTGWDFPFLGHKALGDWQVALGINTRCQHLAWYTMEGEAKRDYPAAIFHQSPWWEFYGHVEDYFARVHFVMTRGEEVRDLLFLHPVESVWVHGCASQGGYGARADALDRDFHKLADVLLAHHLDFDFGDEDLLERHGSVEAKRGAPPRLRMGQAAYKAVVVPTLDTIRRSTLDLLDAFRKAGGLVVFAGGIPGRVEGLPCADATRLADACERASGDDLLALLSAAARRVSVLDAASGEEFRPALALLREDASARYLFVCNCGEDLASAPMIFFSNLARDRSAACDAVEIRVAGPCAAAPVELDASTGAIAPADAAASGDGWVIRTSLPALGSRLFVMPKTKSAAREWRLPARLPAPPPSTLVRRTVLPSRRWAYRLSEANVLVLDRARYRFGPKGAWRAAKEILRIDDELRPTLGAAKRGGMMVQPWAREPVENPRRAQVELAYGFTVDAPPSGDLFLALESPGRCTALLNGVPVPFAQDCGWWVDPSLRKIRLDPLLVRRGANTLVLSVDYDASHPGLEICYLLGSFGAEIRDGTDVAMTALPASLDIGDWCPQGLPFYAGHVAYVATVVPEFAKGERVFVSVPSYRGVALRVLVDGREAGFRGWEPNAVEITGFVGNGRPCELAIEVIGHRRNSHGALHLDEPWPAWHGPDTFKYDPNRWREGYNLVPCGLLAPPALEVRA
ncbi:MAG: glycosyl hydrolase [Kiritimatiellia bacterium]|jgi:hypothetical protein